MLELYYKLHILSIVIKILIFQFINLYERFRKRLIHDISPDNSKIEGWIREYAPSTSTEYLKNLLNEQSYWIKFYLSLVAATANIYHLLNPGGPNLECIQKDTISGKWIFHIKVKE